MFNICTFYPRDVLKLYPRNNREKIMESRNIHDEKRFGPTKYPREKNLDPRKTHKKKYWTHKTPMRKKFANTKYPRQKITDQ